MREWAPISRRVQIHVVTGVAVVVLSASMAVFGQFFGAALPVIGRVGLVAAVTGSAVSTAWAARMQQTRSARLGWTLVAVGLGISVVSFSADVLPALDADTAFLTRLAQYLTAVSFAPLGAGLVLLAADLRRCASAKRVLATAMTLTLVVLLLIAVATLVPVGNAPSVLTAAQLQAFALMCFDAVLLLCPALFGLLSSARSDDADARVWLCLVVGALIMILGDALYPLVSQSAASVVASAPWGMAVVLLACGALISADRARTQKAEIGERLAEPSA